MHLSPNVWEAIISAIRIRPTQTIPENFSGTRTDARSLLSQRVTTRRHHLRTSGTRPTEATSEMSQKDCATPNPEREVLLAKTRGSHGLAQSASIKTMIPCKSPELGKGAGPERLATMIKSTNESVDALEERQHLPPEEAYKRHVAHQGLQLPSCDTHPPPEASKPLTDLAKALHGGSVRSCSTLSSKLRARPLPLTIPMLSTYKQWPVCAF